MNNYAELKEQKKIRNKRTGRTRKIWGWILLVCGAINLMDSFTYMQDPGTVIAALGLAAAGGFLLWSAKRDVAKWDRYEALIDQEGNTPISMLSEMTGIPEDKVRRDIQQMINNGFFRDQYGTTDAYINGEYDVLIMMENGKPKKPVDTQARRRRKGAQQTAETSDADNTDPYAEVIGLAAEKVNDPDVAESLRSIEKSIRKIDRKIIKNPEIENNSSVRQLKTIYLPKTIELIDKLLHEDAGPDALLEIKGILNTCAVAYKSICDKVYKSDDEDTLVDIEVLKQTFEREGLLGSDFDFE